MPISIPLEEPEFFGSRFVVRIYPPRSQGKWGTGFLLTTRIVATCYHVVRDAGEGVLISRGDQATGGTPYTWLDDASTFQDSDQDVAFLILKEPLTCSVEAYPALVRSVTRNFVHHGEMALRSLPYGIMSCGYLQSGLKYSPTTIDQPVSNQQGVVDWMRIRESHRPGESGGPVWLLPPRGLPKVAEDWNPGVVLGMMAQGAGRSTPRNPVSGGSPHSFIVTSDTLLELRDRLIGSFNIDEEHKQLLREIREIDAAKVGTWLPLLLGDPVSTLEKPRDREVRLLFGMVRLAAYTGRIVGHRTSPSREPRRHHGRRTTQTEAHLRLDDGRELCFRYSVPPLEVDPIRDGHRVTVVYATNREGTRGGVASIHAHQTGELARSDSKSLRKTIVGPVKNAAWLFSMVLILLFAGRLDPHPPLVLLSLITFSYTCTTLETWALRKAVAELNPSKK